VTPPKGIGAASVESSIRWPERSFVRSLLPLENPA
jgi:hypothetical protein